VPDSFYLRIKVDTAGGRGGVRDAQGRFMAMGEVRREFRAFNQRMARSIQADAVENLSASIQRRNVSSGRLVAVTASSENIEVDDFHMGVGRTAFLDRSMAKYWRSIEEGSAQAWSETPGGRPGMIGMELTGLWGGSLGKVTSDRAYGARPWYRHSSRRGDMFVPKGKFRQQANDGSFRFAKFQGGAGGSKGAPNFVKTTTIKNEIEAHGYYSDAFHRSDLGPRALAEVNAVLARASRAAWRVE
jgi:hypothetical protein